METTIIIESTVVIKHDREITGAEAVAIGKGIEPVEGLGWSTEELLERREVKLTRYFNHK